MNQFVIVPCPKCGNQVHIAPAAGIGYCPKCMSQVGMPAGGAPSASLGSPGGMPGGYGPAPGAAPAMGGYGPPAGAPPAMGNAPAMGGYGPPAGAPPAMGAAPAMGGYGAPAQAGVGAFGAPGGFPMAGARRPPLAAIFGSIGLTIVGSIAYGVFRTFVGSSRSGHQSVSSLGVEEKAADPDKMLTAVRTLAKKWQSDAELRSINILGLGPNGTVDLSEGGSVVTIEYFSPSRVGSPSASVRGDSPPLAHFSQKCLSPAQ